MLDATQSYANRFPVYQATAFYRRVLDWTVSSLGIGTYLGTADGASDGAYTEALVTAGENGINFFDSAINYRNQHSERCIGAALRRLGRDEIVVCTKAGFLTAGATPDTLRPEDVVGRAHCVAPDFLRDQIERSRTNLGVDTIDVFYVHNPEFQLGFVTREAFEDRIHAAFSMLEELVAQGRIRYYGAATWDGFRKKGALSLTRMAEIAAEVGGAGHHFRFIQFPFNLDMVEAFVDRPENVLESAQRLGIIAVASATLLQARLADEMPDSVAGRLPGLETNAQRAIQFTRSTPGIAVALVGMGRKEHVLENLGIARVAPAPREQYLKLYQ
jgi:aryl-alcohol dehydrogenase-like predicted oxidoreductase